MLIRSKLSILLLVFIATLLAAIAAQANTVYLHQLQISNLNAQFYYQSQIKVKALEIESQILKGVTSVYDYNGSNNPAIIIFKKGEWRQLPTFRIGLTSF